MKKYWIPVNVWQSGKIFNGMLEIRNCIDGGLLALIGFLFSSVISDAFSMSGTSKITLYFMLCLPLFAVGLIGAQGQSIFSFLGSFFRWARNHKPYLYNPHGKAYDKMLCLPLFAVGLIGAQGQSIFSFLGSFFRWARNHKPYLYNPHGKAYDKTYGEIYMAQPQFRDRIGDFVDRLKISMQDDTVYVEGENYRYAEDPLWAYLDKATTQKPPRAAQKPTEEDNEPTEESTEEEQMKEQKGALDLSELISDLQN